MEKYGVLHEMECDCGCKVVVNERQQTVETIKEAGKGLFTEHDHKFKEVLDGNSEGGYVLTGRPVAESRVRENS